MILTRSRSTTAEADRWIAWQFNRREQRDRFEQAFRRPESSEVRMTSHLRGLDPRAYYEIKDFDAEGNTSSTGRNLMETGLSVAIEDKPGAAVIMYRPVN